MRDAPVPAYVFELAGNPNFARGTAKEARGMAKLLREAVAEADPTYRAEIEEQVKQALAVLDSIDADYLAGHCSRVIAAYRFMLSVDPLLHEIRERSGVVERERVAHPGDGGSLWRDIQRASQQLTGPRSDATPAPAMPARRSCQRPRERRTRRRTSRTSRSSPDPPSDPPPVEHRRRCPKGWR